MRSFASGAEPGARPFDSITSFLRVMLDSTSSEVSTAAHSALGRWGVPDDPIVTAYPVNAAGHATVPDGVLVLADSECHVAAPRDDYNL